MNLKQLMKWWKYQFQKRFTRRFKFNFFDKTPFSEKLLIISQNPHNVWSTLYDNTDRVLDKIISNVELMNQARYFTIKWFFYISQILPNSHPKKEKTEFRHPCIVIVRQWFFLNKELPRCYVLKVLVVM